MFSRLRLTGFKAWKDTGDVALRPVTMLLGTNSSGKSSLIQSLLLLKQTVQSPDRTIHLNLGGDETDDLYNFGSFDSVLRQGSATRQFTISLDFQSTGAARIEGGRFECAYGQTSAGSVVVQSLLLATAGRTFRAVRRDKGAFSIYVDGETQPRGKGRHLAPERSITLPAEAVALLGVDGQLVQDLSLGLRRELENITYLGPLRRKPERDYTWNKAHPGEIGSDGHRAVDMLLASTLVRGEEQNQVIDGVSRWLSRMRLADRLEVRQEGRSNRYALVVRRDDVVSNLHDVGIGISQVLPVLVAAYFAPAGSAILLEEPEIHLHPLAQSVLAELFVEVSRERGVQFIVETHSEHLFRRMQTLLAAEKATPEDCAMYFVEREAGAAKMRALQVDRFGRVTNWPEGFFGDALGETREQARLMFERQRRGG
ncbi:MAG: DUF3696 domain-containing protein [Pseudoxanthomonas sp.]|nr:DUF3696 domain-containing protein [Pseudoxanthomonas sp.]